MARPGMVVPAPPRGSPSPAAPGRGRELPRWAAGMLATRAKMPGSTLVMGGRDGHHGGMRYESSVTSLSWIPSEAVPRGARVPFDAGFTHYDDPPPAQIDDVEALRVADKFRFANVLQAWIEVDGNGEITGCGYGGGGMIGDTTIRLGALRHTFQNALLPDVRRDPERGDGWVRFTPDRGRPDRPASAAPGAAQALCPVAGAAGVDDPVAHPARRRQGGVRHDRGEPVPASLALRRGRPAHPQVGPDRFQQLDAGVLRPPHPVGRRGFGRPGHRGGKRAGARAVRAADARRGQAEDLQAARGRCAGPPG